MTISLSKLVPRAIVVAVVGYCTWPSISASISQPESKPAEKKDDVAKVFQIPAMPPSPKRDPFLSEVAAKKLADPSSQKGLGGRGKNKDWATGGRKTDLAGGKDGGERQATPLSGLRLDATYIMGNARMAIINGAIYAPMDALTGRDFGSAKLTLAEVLPDKVLLDCDGSILELAYSDKPSPAVLAAAPRTRAAGSSKSSGRSSGKSRQGNRQTRE